MPAPVAGPAGLRRRSRRIARLLGHAGQGIEFADEHDDRLPAAEAGREGRGHARHAAFDGKPGIRQCLLEQRAAAVFLEPEFGEVPDLLRDGGVLILPGIDRRHDSPRLIGAALREGPDASHDHEPDDGGSLLEHASPLEVRSDRRRGRRTPAPPACLSPAPFDFAQGKQSGTHVCHAVSLRNPEPRIPNPLAAVALAKAAESGSVSTL